MIAQINKKKQAERKKRIVKSTEVAKKKTSNKKMVFSKFVPRSRSNILKTVLALSMFILIAGAIPLPYTFAKSAPVSFTDVSEDSAEFELGDSEVIQEGRDGMKTIEVKSLQSIWGRLLDLNPLQQKETTSTISEEPVNRITANGTRKYQYMLCSDGSYRYYSDEEFKDDKVGFTSKSQDDCAANNNGHKVSLTNSKPSNNSTSPVSRPTSTTQPYSYEAEKIDREVAKLNWCNEEDKRIGDEYIGKVQKARATYNTTEEFNAIVEPAYYKYSYQMKSLNSSGCNRSLYPDYTRR